jgi:hypothetical protein
VGIRSFDATPMCNPERPTFATREAPVFEFVRGCPMRLIFRSTAWAFGALVGLGLSAAQGQQPYPAYYYPAPGFYATTRGTVQITKAGYYLNVPLNAVPAARLVTVPSSSSNSNPAQTYSGSRSPARPSIPVGRASGVRPITPYANEPDPGWQFRL